MQLTKVFWSVSSHSMLAEIGSCPQNVPSYTIFPLTSHRSPWFIAKLSLRVCTVPSFVLPVRYSFNKPSCLVQDLQRQICGHHFQGKQESQKGSNSQCTLIITCPIYQPLSLQTPPKSHFRCISHHRHDDGDFWKSSTRDSVRRRVDTMEHNNYTNERAAQ